MTRKKVNMGIKYNDTGYCSYSIEHKDLIFWLTVLDRIGHRWAGRRDILTAERALIFENCIHNTLLYAHIPQFESGMAS